jgi:hypothetical protein
MASVLLLVAALACFARVGADCLWLVALGDHIREHGEVPDGIPFAAARTDGWPNAVVAAEIALSLVHSVGLPALVVTQLLMAAGALVLLALGARDEGATDASTARVLPLFAVGAVTGLAIVRLQLFSLVPFAALFWLLRSQHRRPTRTVWLLPLLVAVWTNLHGAVLLGVAVAGAYLLFSRLRVRPRETLAVGATTLAAVLATPAGLRTVDYYLGVAGNEAARQHTGLWARLSPTAPFDVALVVAGAVLVGLAVRHRLPVWEWVALLGLALATVAAARNGVWLLMWAVAPAAAGRSDAADASVVQLKRFATSAIAFSAAVATAIVLPRSSELLGVDRDVVESLARAAGDGVVLAPEPLAEALAADGATLWVLDPVDAFDRSDQRAYLEFLDHGDPSGALPHVDVVIVETDSEAARHMEQVPAFIVTDRQGDWTVFERG